MRVTRSIPNCCDCRKSGPASHPWPHCLVTDVIRHTTIKWLAVLTPGGPTNQTSGQCIMNEPRGDSVNLTWLLWPRCWTCHALTRADQLPRWLARLYGRTVVPRMSLPILLTLMKTDQFAKDVALIRLVISQWHRHRESCSRGEIKPVRALPEINTTLQRQKAVTAHLQSKQLLPFDVACQITGMAWYDQSGLPWLASANRRAKPRRRT